jgi:hypothetical protein
LKWLVDNHDDYRNNVTIDEERIGGWESTFVAVELLDSIGHVSDSSAEDPARDGFAMDNPDDDDIATPDDPDVVRIRLSEISWTNARRFGDIWLARFDRPGTSEQCKRGAFARPPLIYNRGGREAKTLSPRIEAGSGGSTRLDR